MKLIDLEQGSQQWLSFRRMGIGASDAPSIMGVGFKSPHQLYMDKMTGSETKMNSAMQRGKDLEPLARDLFTSMTGIDVEPLVAISDELSWQFASLDGLSKDHAVMVEIKCPGYKDHATAKEGMIPGKYYPQLQHQFSVTGCKTGYYFSFDGKNGVIVEIHRNDEYIDKLLVKEKEFYERMLSFEPPQLMQQDVIVLNDPEWNELCKAYKTLKHDMTNLEEKEKRIKERLISIAAERNIKSNDLHLTKILRKGNVEYGKIPQLQGVDLEEFRKSPSIFWKFGLS